MGNRKLLKTHRSKDTFGQYLQEHKNKGAQIPLPYFSSNNRLVGPDKEIIEKISTNIGKLYLSALGKSKFVHLVFVSMVLFLGYELLYNTYPSIENTILVSAGSIAVLTVVYFVLIKPRIEEVSKEEEYYGFILSSCRYLDDNFIIRDHIYRLAQKDKYLMGFLRRINTRDLTWYEAAEILKRHK